MGLKIAVYAIARNEGKFAVRWAQSMAEADWVVVLDTGSTDDTVQKLKENGVTVFCERIEPWRFDVARNRSLFYVPREADICVCTDLDEVFDSGWRAELEAAWRPGTTRARYRYTWKYDDQGREEVVYLSDKIHTRFGYHWRHPVHEVLVADGMERFIEAPIHIGHYPDPDKSRAQYLPLLELAVKEEPDDRNYHYLGREYLFQGKWERAIDTLKTHLNLPTATWAEERANSMRFLARAYLHLGQKAEAERWYLRAIAEAPAMREPYLEYALWLYEREDWAGVYFLTERALAIKERPLSYVSESAAWGGMLPDLHALAAYRLGRKKEALEWEKAAVCLSPEDTRMAENLAFYTRECALEATTTPNS